MPHLYPTALKMKRRDLYYAEVSRRTQPADDRRSELDRGLCSWVQVGLGHLAIQNAKVMGMRVIVVDGGAEKEKICLSLGAERFIDYPSVKTYLPKSYALRHKARKASSSLLYRSRAMLLRLFCCDLEGLWSRLMFRPTRL